MQHLYDIIAKQEMEIERLKAEAAKQESDRKKVKIINAIGKTFYCEYCGARVPPGAEHECDWKYEEDRDAEEEAD